MDTFWTELLQNLFRWIHVVAGILWIGLLYFFNFVNSAFAPTMDAETKKKVLPELLPRTLFFFRWGAAFTWVTGVLLLALVFYHHGITFESGKWWSVGTFVMIAITFMGVYLYDILAKNLKEPRLLALVSLVLVTIVVLAYQQFGGFSYRGYVIHLGALFGTIMAYNVWFRIWPAQQKIITSIKGGQAPDAALVGLAGLRSKHNTYLSVPLVWTMLNAHSTFLTECWWSVVVVVALGWALTRHLYQISARVKGF